MDKHLLVVLTNPVEGQEDTFNQWYNDVHLKDVLAIPGIVAGQRFQLSDVQRDDSSPPWRYLALYEIETNDLNALLAAIKERAGTSAMIFSDALALDLAAWLLNPITSRIEG